MGKPLIDQYKIMHKNPKRFPGNSTKRYVSEINLMIETHEAKTLLDYGSGKGMQYLNSRVHEQWGGILPTCYDPGFAPLSKRPEGTFDGVICTDVMEHIEERDVVKVLEDIFDYANKFVFLGIACFPASKTLPDGRNCHVTIRSPGWWDNIIDQIAADKSYSIKYEVESKQ